MTRPIRRAAHAGSFYAAEPARLRATVTRLLEEARGQLPELHSSDVVGTLVPHAGIAYSGPLAALGWTVVSAAHPDTIVIVGTDHRGLAGGLGAWTGGAWGCPLGGIQVDVLMSEQLAQLGGGFRPAMDAHLDEHSIEVQLPFIAVAMPTAAIVPLLVDPRLSPDACAAAGRTLGEALRVAATDRRRIVVACSSDFAHYPAEEAARRVTARLLPSILALDAMALSSEERALMASGEPGLVCGMCGLQATMVALAALAAMGATGGVELGAATSADVPPHETWNTVGYAAAAFLREGAGLDAIG